jgi:UDP-N-acetylmuramoyl-tripeptide--D-alanyl-D-alanine ligase
LINRAIPYSDPTGIGLIVEPLPSELNLAVSLKYKHKTYNIQTGLFGGYNLENIKAAIATGLFLDVEIDDICDAIGKYQPGNNRSQIKTTPNNTLACDSYNANPTSMMLAIKSFSELKASKKVFILGDMLELGEKSIEEHINILKALKSLKPDKVLLVGDIFQKASDGFGFKSFKDVVKLREYFKSEPVKGCFVLIKGSRGMTLEKLYDLL